MANGIVEVVETVPRPYCFKVHNAICTVLMKLVNRISSIVPNIEAARPCSAGMRALSSLRCEIDKANKLLNNCCESSKLYLALSSDAVAAKCQKSRDILERNLTIIQSSVPVLLALKICRIIEDLKSAKFVLDASEAEAGKVMREFIRKFRRQDISTSDLTETLAIRALKLVASSLHMMSHTAILMEKRSIRSLIVKDGDRNLSKNLTLKLLLHILEKYESSIVGNTAAEDGKSYTFENSRYACMHGEQNNKVEHIPPDEFKCPMSLRLMYDPVIIASGQTFERMWIQRWFNEGHDTCPKTKEKLADQSLAPDNLLKHQISQWCAENGIRVTNPSIQADNLCSWEASLISINSLGSLANEFVESDCNCGPPRDTTSPDLRPISAQVNNSKVCRTSRFRKPQSFSLLPLLQHLPWESQCEVVEDAKNYLIHDDQAVESTMYVEFLEPLVQFLVDARDRRNAEAQRSGSQLIQACVGTNRCGAPCLQESAFYLLASLLDSEASEQVLATLDALSTHKNCRQKIAASGALAPILHILNHPIRAFQESALKILNNLSNDCFVHQHLMILGCVPKMVPFLEDDRFTTLVLKILRNLCDSEEAITAIAETEKCIASVADYLETANSEDQENAVTILLSLCCEHIRYCKLVLEESYDIYSSLIKMKMSGSGKLKMSAIKLLSLFKDI